VAD
jgi:hypothetical protein